MPSGLLARLLPVQVAVQTLFSKKGVAQWKSIRIKYEDKPEILKVRVRFAVPPLIVHTDVKLFWQWNGFRIIFAEITKSVENDRK